jgi:hypothetical protein
MVNFPISRLGRFLDRLLNWWFTRKIKLPSEKEPPEDTFQELFPDPYD